MLKQMVVGACALLGAVSADAVVVTVNGAFTATDWSVYFGTPSAPIDPLFLTYSATFDTDLEYTDDATVLTIGSTNIPYAIRFSKGAGDGAVLVLATAGDPDSCTHFTSTFCAFVSDYMTGTPTFVEQSPADGGGWVAGTITGGVVPEPATWAMMIAGFGLVGGAMRRRRMVAV
ncbi:PEP-CTERM sorting domain-containing protein [Sandaracinobacteroides saxicola]|uniref:PEP-CTERM sorting domain-containing protein n=1 Tax=Sandaracinobacteroides saxicola TaxID=2759707 RepID=A0A7G5IJ23_9SPHN|nr:PEPxxWA-CTERM sorting domain-containing protein [Sandaracinobacteroides saxicola]QMW23365.1 PEP-CTERM sorting domain-containing protein [Sandaracinobacteroides saxicola]